MGDAPAVRLAIDLLHLPARIRYVRSQPLPDGVFTLLNIAAGDEQVTAAAAAAVDRSSDLVREAAAFFIEQILLCPDADSYRVLGSDRRASAAELRRNMVLLLRWLHPDVVHAGNRSIFALRVTGAWEDLKTPQRRAAYDKRQRKNKRAGPALQQNRRMVWHRASQPKRQRAYRAGAGLVVAWCPSLKPLRSHLISAYAHIG